jgi:hypothetical protein
MVRFIDRGNQSIRSKPRKPQTCPRSLTNCITRLYRVHLEQLVKQFGNDAAPLCRQRNKSTCQERRYRIMCTCVMQFLLQTSVSTNVYLFVVLSGGQLFSCIVTNVFDFICPVQLFGQLETLTKSFILQRRINVLHCIYIL